MFYFFASTKFKFGYKFFRCSKLLNALELNLCPSNQVPPLAIFSRFLPLLPKPLDAEVQKGITVLLVKTFSLTKLSTDVLTSEIILNVSSSCSLLTLEFLLE